MKKFLGPSLFLFAIFSAGLSLIGTFAKADETAEILPELQAIVAPARQVVPTPKEVCGKTLQKFGYTAKDAKARCQFQEILTRVNSVDYEECTELVTATGAQREFAPFCLYYKSQKISEKVLNCMRDSQKTAEQWFWYYEDFTSFNRGAAAPNVSLLSALLPALAPPPPARRFPPSAFMDRFLSQCESPTPAPKADPGVRVVSQYVIHSYNPIQGSSVLLGGLSGIVLKDGKFLVVTDDKDNPAIHEFEYNPENKPVPWKFKKSQKIPFGKYADNDFEDLTFTRQGDLLVSSETVVTPGEKSALRQEFVFKISPNFKTLTSVDLPDELYPSTSSAPKICPPTKEPEKRPDFIPLTKPSNSLIQQAAFTEPAVAKPKNCGFDYFYFGFQPNKGLEAMAADPESDHLYFAPEKPLSDHVASPFVPLYQMDSSLKNSVPLKVFQYPLKNFLDNGLSGMTVVDENHLLMLERAFDPILREANVRLYLVKLSADPTEPLKKTIVVQFSNLKSQLSAGFQNIENFEGLTLGPANARGDRLLYLVSDNNFSVSQRTDFLVLELKGDLLR